MAISVTLPRVGGPSQELDEAIKQLPDREAVEVFHQCDLWAATVENGREVIGVLNHRYDLVVRDCGSGLSLAAAYDTVRRELVLAKLLRNGNADCQRVAEFCAAALGERIDDLDCY